MWAGKIERSRVGCGPLVSPYLWFFPLTLWLRATLNYLNAWNQFEINKSPRGLIENYDMQYTSGWWSRLRHVVWRHSAFVFLWPFSKQEIILPMNFDGGRVKIEVRETLFCVFAGKFHRPCRAYILQRRWLQLFSNQNSAYKWKIPLNSRLIRLDQHETTFTGINPRRNTLNTIFFAKFSVFSAVAQWSERLLGLQVVRI